MPDYASPIPSSSPPLSPTPPVENGSEEPLINDAIVREAVQELIESMNDPEKLETWSKKLIKEWKLEIRTPTSLQKDLKGLTELARKCLSSH